MAVKCEVGNRQRGRKTSMGQRMTLDPDLPPSAPKADWNSFRIRHANHEFIAIDPLLRIDRALLERLKSAMPTVVTEIDELFEADLRETTQFGFVFRKGLPEMSPTFWKRHDDTSRQISDMLAEELLREGHSEATITEHFLAESKRNDAVKQIQDAYCGWLLFNAEYQSELAELKKQSSILDGLGGFPSLIELPPLGIPSSMRDQTPSIERVQLIPRSVEQETLISHVKKLAGDTGQNFLVALRNLYEKWELAKLVHWDIPIPQSPAYRMPVINSEPELHTKGVTFSFPWFLLRSQRLTLSEIISEEIDLAAPSHLTDWLKLLHSKKGHPAPKTYERLAELHRLFYLTLFPRYGARDGFRTSKVEQVLAEHFKTTAETIRKDLQRLGRMVNKAKTTPPDRGLPL